MALVHSYENRLREMQLADQNNRVREATGMDFTPGNMMQVTPSHLIPCCLGFGLGVFLAWLTFRPMFFVCIYTYVCLCSVDLPLTQ